MVPYQYTVFVRFPAKDCVTSRMIEKALNQRDLNWILSWFRNAIKAQCRNLSTTPITAMGCRQYLPLSGVQLKGKHCQKTHCRNGVVDTFGQSA